MIRESRSGGIHTLILSNGTLSVKILAGKGGDINQITYLPEKMDFLHVEQGNFACYEGRDLSVNRLSHYSEDSTGGWQDVVPGYGRYGQKVLRDYPVGIAATVPWNFSEAAFLPEDGGERNEAVLSVHLPQFPLYMVKRIRLEGETLSVHETIRNEGSEPAAFTWTQHSVFGGGFLDGQVEITYPGDEIFLSSLYAAQGGNKDDFRKSIKKAPMPDGTDYNLQKMREPMPDGQLIFTMKANTGAFALTHREKKIGCRVDWDKQIFPYVRCWYRNTAEGYSFAMEPCNYAYSSFDDTDREDMYLHLEPGEEIGTQISFRVTSSV